jgi:D-glycero-D-manno-heptose 1,7-bisphosphate phosphatase
MTSRRPGAVFLDRDGTINREVHHLNQVEQVELLEGAAEAIRLLNGSGFKVVVVTNQGAVARGLLPESRLAEIHAALVALLARSGAAVDAIYYCPHHPTEGVGDMRRDCGCRKPRPGALQQAAGDLGLDLECSFLVGDQASDVEAGRAAGCRTVLVRTGYGAKTETELHGVGVHPDHVAADLLEAVRWILHQGKAA